MYREDMIETCFRGSHLLTQNESSASICFARPPIGHTSLALPFRVDGGMSPVVVFA
jgi:hypothetical protein